ncbi:MAG: hypothetical protein ABSC25_11560 [Roseiarcus sp.]
MGIATDAAGAAGEGLAGAAGKGLAGEALGSETGNGGAPASPWLSSGDKLRASSIADIAAETAS